mgnify:CR=1 FL=1
MNYWDILLWMFAVIGFTTTLIKLLELFGKFFDTVAVFLKKVKIYVYYPIIIRINKRRHKNYIEEYFNDLIFRNPIEWPLAVGKIKIEWSDEESVDVDLEENILLVRVEYANKVEDILAKIAFLVAPYLVSEYLEPALGEKFSRLVSIGIIEDILQLHPPILNKFRKLINEVYGKDNEYMEISSMITKADDTSLYKHIFLYELRKILSKFGARVDKDRLTRELKELLYIIANLEDISAPKVCGYYISLTIVRVGKLMKVAFQLWEPYIQYIENVLKDCSNLQRIYIVSAGGFTSKAVKGLLEYMEKKLPNLHLLDRFEYKARYYKGKTNVPHMVAVMELK